MKILLESIYSNYYSDLVKTAYYYLGCATDSEDIVQDVFLHIWEKIKVSNISGQYDVGIAYTDYFSQLLSACALQATPRNSILVAYLYYIKKAVENKCLDYIRYKQKMKYIYCSEDAQFEYYLNNHYCFDPTDTPTTSEEALIIIERAINKLPDKCRQIFVDSRIEGEKHKDIALKYNLSMKTIESQMNIAYKKLKLNLNNVAI
jgi:RNA polymerase sigma factor (sigma-70 family)